MIFQISLSLSQRSDICIIFHTLITYTSVCKHVSVSECLMNVSIVSMNVSRRSFDGTNAIDLDTITNRMYPITRRLHHMGALKPSCSLLYKYNIFTLIGIFFYFQIDVHLSNWWRTRVSSVCWSTLFLVVFDDFSWCQYMIFML